MVFPWLPSCERSGSGAEPPVRLQGKAQRLALIGLLGWGPGLTTGCGATAPRPVQTGAGQGFSSQDLVLFDDGVDWARDFGQLSGDHWHTDLRSELAQRVDRAEAIAEVQIDTVVHRGLEGGETWALTFRRVGAVRGELPESWVWSSTPASPGWRTLRRAGQRLLGPRFLVFVRWEAVTPPQGEGQGSLRRVHFHLTPASGAAYALIRGEEARPGQRGTAAVPEGRPSPTVRVVRRSSVPR